MSSSREVFQVVLIKPTHYDDNGYPSQWLRSLIPSNTLASLNGLALDCNERQVLGSHIEIRPVAIDETNTRIRAHKIIRDIERSGGRGLICFVGVQSNQFPRAVDLAEPFLAARMPVAIGGFHVSGCLSMLPELPREILAAQDMGISIFAGEADDGRLDPIIQDAYNGALKPIYNHMDDLPSIEGQPIPFLPRSTVKRTMDRRSSFDMGRGCPFQCSFCTIINVQGRKSRYRTADDVERIVRSNVAQGIHKFFITDDNFARNKVWESMFDRLIELREEDGIDLKLTIQVDTMCHKIRDFVEKAGRAGVEKVFIGLESINPESLNGSRKTQNNITEYRRMLQAWHAAGAVTCAGYILGFPTDTHESILRDIKIIQRELPVDCLEFFILIPLPGSQDHKELWEQGIAMDTDMNNYDSVHVLTAHARMSDEEWLGIYHEAWEAYYTPEHVETVMRRAKQWGNLVDKVKWVMFSFHSTARIERLHPLDGGLLRRKVRTDRRSGLALENPIIFHARYACETLSKSIRLVAMYLAYQRRYKRVMAGRSVAREPDVAMAPVEKSEMDSLELFNVTSAARSVVVKMKKKAERREQRRPAVANRERPAPAPAD